MLFIGYLFGWSNLQVAHNQHRLLTTYAVGTCPKYSTSCAAEYAAFNGVIPADGKAAAVLQIPALGLKQVVVEGTTASDLQQGPGLMPATSVPGSAGEAVIAGRKLTFGGAFAHIDDLRPGDAIGVVDFLGSFKFVVVSQFVVPAGHALPVLHSNLGLLALVDLGTGGAAFRLRRRRGQARRQPGRRAPPAARSDRAIRARTGG